MAGSRSALFLVDITYEVFRSYYGAPEATAPDGRPIGAVQGLCASLLRLLRDPRLTHVAGATDHVIESFRNDLFAGYKTGDGMPEDLVAQFEPAEEAVRALGMTLWPMVEFEADDALAAAAHQFGAQVDDVFVCTPDKDLMQVVGGNVRLWDRRRDILYDAEAVRAKMGIEPRSVPDYLALVGDTADGIPGLPGWGATSAAVMLAEFGSIDDFPGDSSAWPPGLRGREKLLRTFQARRSDLELYRTLARLRVDVHFEQSLEDLRFAGVPRDRWLAFCENHGISTAVREGGLKLAGEGP